MMPIRLASRFFRTNYAATRLARATAPRQCSDPQACLQSCRCFAQVKDLDCLNRNVWFNSSVPLSSPPELRGDHKPPDERTLQLGKTVRALHERLPNLLKEPLPSEILSPQITLHLFPSTHPHLPTVSGRLAYIAALWTAPVAWGRVPLVGNVSLIILSERMVKNGGSSVPSGSREEKLVVKWKTCGKTSHRDGTGGIYRGVGSTGKDPVDKIRDFISGVQRTASERTTPDNEEFCGIFVFEFDEKGRVVKHTIEHTEEGGHWDRMARVVSVTDWLLGQFNGKRKEEPAFAWCEERPSGMGIKFVDRSHRH